MSAPVDNLTTRRATYAKAKMAWNRDGGPIEQTIKVGEDLYFAADFLVEAQDEQRVALAEALVKLIAAARQPSYQIGYAAHIEAAADEAQATFSKALGQDGSAS